MKSKEGVSLHKRWANGCASGPTFNFWNFRKHKKKNMLSKSNGLLG